MSKENKIQSYLKEPKKIDKSKLEPRFRVMVEYYEGEISAEEVLETYSTLSKNILPKSSDY